MPVVPVEAHGDASIAGQFNNLEQDAKKAEAAWLERTSHRFDPDRDDEGSVYEAAEAEGIVYYQMLEDMRDDVRLGIVAGMYHQWDKQFREWIVQEVSHWHRGPKFVIKFGRRNSVV
jgi:hypothetical protein